MIVLYILGGILAVGLLYILFLVVCSLFINSQKEYDNHSRFYRALLNGATTVAIRIMRIHLHVSGIEKIPADTKNILFVSNHRSNFDPIVTWHILKRWQPAFISKASNFKIPVFGRFIRKCCFMAIDRENPRNAIKAINKAAELLKKGEVSIGVYPEGTRSKTGELLSFHNGVFKIAQKADAPIVVLAISGTERIHKNYPFHRSNVYVDVLEVIPSQSVKESKTDTLGNRIRALLEEHLSIKYWPYRNRLAIWVDSFFQQMLRLN